MVNPRSRKHHHEPECPEAYRSQGQEDYRLRGAEPVFCSEEHECKKEKSRHCCKKEENCPFRLESFLPEPDVRGCFHFFPILTKVEVEKLSAPPMVSLLATDGNWHFPGETDPGYPFWFIITAQKQFVIVVPEKSFCFYPVKTPYLLTLNFI